jgi:hypothetical protein
MPRLHPDLSENPSFLDCIFTGDEVMGISICPTDEMSEHAMNLKVITKAQEVSFPEVQDHNHGDHIFDKQCVIHREFVPEGQIVNSAFYAEVIGRLLKRISRARPQVRLEGSWFLLHDNAPSHSALAVKIFLAKHGVVEISHPPYSPDLAPVDFFLFPTVKTALKGKRFQDVESIKKNVTAELNAALLEAFADCFQKPFERYNKYIQVGGDYFE